MTAVAEAAQAVLTARTLIKNKYTPVFNTFSAAAPYGAAAEFYVD